MSETVLVAAETPQILLEHHLKTLRLPTMLREYDRVARQCAVEDVDYPRYLLRMAELELLDRERRATERRIRQAKFPVTKSLDKARDEKKLLRFQKQIASYELLIVDELGFVPLSKTGAELLFEMLSQRYERSATMVTSNLPFAEWTEVLGSERLTGALLDRLTHHVHILEMNGDSYRLKQSRRKRGTSNS